MVLITEYSDGLVVRTAGPEDKDGAVEIDAYANLDYLRGKYDHFMENPDYLCFLAELQGRVVAFCYMCLIDDGEAVIEGAKRSHKDFQGQGYFARFIKPVEGYIVSQHPRLKVWKYAALWSDYQKKHVPHLRKVGALRKLLFRNGSLFDISIPTLQSEATRQKIQQLCKDYDVDSQVELVRDENVPAALLDKATQEQLFPENIVVVFWEPYAPLLSNFEYIMRTSKCNITSSSSSSSSKVKVKAVSFLSNVETTEQTIRVDINLYVSAELSVDERKRHFQQHLIKAMQMLSENAAFSGHHKIIFCVYTSNDHDNEENAAWVVEKFPVRLSERLYPGAENIFQCIFCEYDRDTLMAARNGQ